ncbi:M17 family metallopeptidase [Mycoplasma tauri]|uniref:M17 family metallopeptidase n=1 Tax=Mycoplasma tauri TaxID=547987 RepID=UPI001CBF2333|nr:M17 family metallopeptidase [Mycoplasma tauri]MBZ4204204.1 leucyl aminopeptidase family protein [Mycoplasma tauri]
MNLFEKISVERNDYMLLSATFADEIKCECLIKKQGKITEYFDKNQAFIYFKDKTKLTFFELEKTFKNLAQNANRNYQVDLNSFSTDVLSVEMVADAFIRAVYFVKGEIYDVKTGDKPENYELVPYVVQTSKELEESVYKSVVLAKSVNFARNLQITPPNICNSEYLADFVAKDLSQYNNLKVTVLNKKQIEENEMGLLLSVNRGSVYEPRVVVIEYNGDPDSNEKTVMIGKGITFDSGGYSLKPSRSMLTMKFDMSGSVIVASAMKSLAQLKPKKNVAAIMCITDNRVNGDASIPDSVWKAMNGKTVEINNTDAEGRLVMADGLVYGARKLGATRLVDVATLTGAIVIALGQTYTGVWTTTDKAWDDLLKASNRAHELVWRMPFDEEFGKNIRSSKVADLKNTDLSGNAGSCSAAMFLKEFTDNIEFIHLDVAGTAEINEEPQGIMVKTLVELNLN